MPGESGRGGAARVGESGHGGPHGAAPPRPAGADGRRPDTRGDGAGASPAAPVTEWDVVAIPGDPAPLAVDDEPEDAASAPVRTLTAPRDGDVIVAPDRPADVDANDDDEVPPPVDTDLPARAAAPMRADGIERVGEAVVRQVLDARFVGEEPYTPPTRFN